MLDARDLGSAGRPPTAMSTWSALSVRAAPLSLSATVTVRGPVNVAVPSTRAMPALSMLRA